MGFPSHGVESCYRNPYEDERTFLDERHAGKYKVFNLCGEAERQYDPALFYGRACTYGWLDHEACPFNLVCCRCRHSPLTAHRRLAHAPNLHSCLKHVVMQLLSWRRTPSMWWLCTARLARAARGC